MGHAFNYFEIEKGFVWPDNSKFLANIFSMKAKRLIAGVLCVIAAMSFVLAGIFVLLNLSWQNQLIIVSVITSTILLIAAFSTAIFFGCEEDNTDTAKLTEEEEAVIMEDAAADNVVEAMDYEVDYYSSSQETIDGINGSKKSTEWRRARYVDGEGPAITVDPTGSAYPKTITINYWICKL